jgi:DNA-binding MarR family transcriptional regulator
MTDWIFQSNPNDLTSTPRWLNRGMVRGAPLATVTDTAMTTGDLDPLIHVPTRLKIVATLAALPDGDTLSFTRLQDMIGLTPGNLIIHLRKLEDADYITSSKTSNGNVSVTTVALTGHGRAALGAYTQALRNLLDGL